MVHGDDDGLIIPPRVAPIQVVIVPIYRKNNMDQINDKCTEVEKILVSNWIRCESDLRDNYKSGWKYNYWENKGVPVRIEIGQNDLEKKQVVAVRRDSKQKSDISLDTLVNSVKELLVDIQISLYQKAKKHKDSHKKSATTWKEFLQHLNSKNIVKVPFCCTEDCEGDVKRRSAEESKAQATDQKFDLTGAAKSLCIPFEQDELPKGTKCFGCDKDAVSWTLFGRSY